MKTALLVSTAGSVFRHAAAHSQPLRESLALVVGDRDCPGLALGAELGVPRQRIDATDATAFSDALSDLLEACAIDYVYVFFTRILRGRLLQKFSQRLVNFHPSLLPACPGLDGIGDSLAAGALVIGSTVHFIDSGVDSGPQILQSLLPVAPSIPPAALRHEVFVQQCRSLIQVDAWLRAGRVECGDRRVVVRGAPYLRGEFVPSLDSPLAQSFGAPPQMPAG